MGFGSAPALLRFRQEKEFEPVGGDETAEADVRVIAATNVDLEEAVRQGKFRRDLFYRLNVFEIRVPPLRERQEDIPLLAAHFIEKYGAERGVTSVAPEAMDALMFYSWPGNIRELENTIQAAVIHAEVGIIRLQHLPKCVAEHDRPPASRTSINAAAQETAGQARRKEVGVLLAKYGNRVAEVARVLGVTKSYVYRVRRQGKQK